MRHTCPKCGTDETPHRTRRRFLDRFLSLVGWYPYRCGYCEARFYRRKPAVRVEPNP